MFPDPTIPYNPIPGLWAPWPASLNSYTPDNKTFGLSDDDKIKQMMEKARNNNLNEPVAPPDGVESLDTDWHKQTTYSPFSKPEPKVKLPNAPQPKDQKDRSLHLNYNHIFASNVIGAFGQFLGNENENSLQNAARRYDALKFSPLNYLPDNPNVSKQGLYGMDQFSEGGPISDDDPKRKKLKTKGENETLNAIDYGNGMAYNGVVDDNGTDDYPTLRKTFEVLGGYLRNNWWETSNVYRLPLTHNATRLGTKDVVLDTAKKGGKISKYKEGGEYDLSEDEINELIAQGYQIEKLK